MKAKTILKLDARAAVVVGWVPGNPPLVDPWTTVGLAFPTRDTELDRRGEQSVAVANLVPRVGLAGWHPQALNLCVTQSVLCPLPLQPRRLARAKHEVFEGLPVFAT